MQDKQEIVLSYYVKGLKKSEIVERTGFNWRTVNKYINRYEAERQKLKAVCGDSKVPCIIEDLICEPKYNSSKRSKRKITEDLVLEIRNCLNLNQEHSSAGRHKQKMKKIDVYEHVIKLGYDIGYTSVCTLIKEELKHQKEAFIKQQYVPGEVCEFDWGEVKLEIAGKQRAYYIAVFTAAYSNYRYAVLFERENTQSFQTAHALFFTQIKGSYRQMVYDNMRVAVKRFVGKHEKEATIGLLKLSLYYLFDFRFCNVYSGNEKGHVERSVEYIRRKAFCRQSAFTSLDEANRHLVSILEDLNSRPLSTQKKKSAADLFEEEKAYLGEVMPPFECAELTSARVDKFSTISLFQNRYSVPDKYVGTMIDVKVYSNRIEVFDDREKVCEHIRSYESKTWTLDLKHYLHTLKQKPGALKNSVAFKQTEHQLQRLYHTWFAGQEKDFIILLHYMKTEDILLETVVSAVEKVVLTGSKTVTSDAIKMVLANIQNDESETAYYHGAIEEASASQLEQYGTLFISDGGHS